MAASIAGKGFEQRAKRPQRLAHCVGRPSREESRTAGWSRQDGLDGHGLHF